MASYNYNPVGLQYATTVSISRPGRQRHFYTDNQLELLHAEFTAEPFPCRESRNRIALQLGVSEKSVMWWFQNHRRRLRQQSKGVSSTVTLVARRTRQHRRQSPYVCNVQPHPLALGWTDSFTGTEWSTHPPEYQPQFSASIAEDCSSTSSSPINYRHPPPPTSFDHQDHTFEERYQQPTNDIPQEANPSYTELDQQWNSFMQSPHFVSNGNSYQSTMNCSSELYAFPQRRSCYYSDCSHYQNYW